MYGHLKKDKKILSFLAILGLGTLTGCWESSNNAQVDHLKFNAEIPSSPSPNSQRWQKAQLVLADHCVSCHLDYRAKESETFIQTGLILPGLPDHSPLYIALKGANVSVPMESMPPQGVLSPQELFEIRDWISNLE